MPSCTHCGALDEGAATTLCPSCGMPREGGAPGTGTGRPVADTGHGYVRVGTTILPLWLLWLMAALVVAGVVAAVVLSSSTGSSYDGETIGISSSPTPTPDPAIGSLPPTGLTSSPPSYYESPPPTDFTSPTPADTSPSPESASAVVEEYYRDINARDFSAAWDLGGKNIGGTSYSQWKSGFDSTAAIELSAVDDGSFGQVSAVLHATQTDGSVRVFQGTYTVSDGAIIRAAIRER
ncbi:hypothetical protein [Streptomyces sp. NPDC058773]|uniref:hypothetical protein n=1 Tax=Streptomyces sp. NPDC058773 TaxID=3346632 RepID=UPI0036A8D25F